MSRSKSRARRAAGLLLVLGLVGTCWGLSRPKPERPHRPSNLLLITIDTWRADALGTDGGRRTSPTPTIDRLADAGLRFTDARAHNVVTLPSHVNILTGRLPPDHGVRDNGGFRLSPDIDTLATHLRRRGYRTGAFVSAFPLDSRFGLAAGFDTYDDRLGGGSRPAFLIQERSAAETVALARTWIEAGGGTPWFSWVHVYEPHYPYVAPGRFRAAWPNDPYLGEVAAADAALGPLLDPIRAAGATGDTLVVVTSDHGEALGDHGEVSHGVFAYESVLRVPLVIYAPGLFAAGRVDVPAGHVDLMPTILDALAVPIPDRLAGRSLLPVIAGDDQDAGAGVYFEALSASLTRGWAPLRGIVHGGFKYIDLPLPELYDLGSDPGETQNLADGDPRTVDELRARLDQFGSADPRLSIRSESAEVRDRLRSLGYVTGDSAVPTAYTERDDPKRLIALDSIFQDILDRYLTGDLAGALARCRELVARRPSMAVSWMQLAQLEREAGNLSAAIDAMRKALALRPGDAEPLRLMAAYLTEAGRAREAVDLLGSDARLADADPDLLATQALALARLGRFDEARAVLTRAREADPLNALPLVHLGTVELTSGRRAAARTAFNAAVAIDPGLARAHSSLGVLALEEGRPADAAEHWRAAIAKDPDEPGRILTLGIALVRAGRRADARVCFEFFVANAPESRYADELGRARGWLNGVR